MIERLENVLQIAVLLVSTNASLYKAIRTHARAWTLLAFFSGSWCLGDIYWLVCLLFYDRTPQISVVSDMSWYASYIFLYMLLREVAPPATRRETRALPWLGILFAAGMAAFYMQWGEFISNIIYAGLMGLLLFSAIRRIMDGALYRRQRPLSAVILIFCLLEYGLWTTSCFFKGEGLLNPYYWFDILLTVSFLFFFHATERAVTA